VGLPCQQLFIDNHHRRFETERRLAFATFQRVFV